MAEDSYEDYGRSATFTIPIPETVEEFVEMHKNDTPPRCLCAWYEHCEICDPEFYLHQSRGLATI